MDLPLQIVFESKDFVALDKPAGWLTVPGRTGRADPRPCLGIRLAQHYDRNVFPVHRLDAEVSGLVLFARHADSHRAANGWFEERTVRKLYQALTRGPPPDRAPEGAHFEWHSMLVRGKKRAFRAAHGKEAVTMAHYVRTIDWPAPGAEADAELGANAGAGRASASTSPALLWELEPRTGRSHQLRFELTDHGCPILGDSLYGSPELFRGGERFLGGIALRSVWLSFAEVRAKALAASTPFPWELPEAIEIPGFV